MSRRIDPLTAVAIWLALFGVWPLADPGHHGDTPASMLDIALHAGAALFLVLDWWVNHHTDTATTKETS